VSQTLPLEKVSRYRVLNGGTPSLLLPVEDCAPMWLLLLAFAAFVVVIGGGGVGVCGAIASSSAANETNHN
jgi:hypothetical protein